MEKKRERETDGERETRLFKNGIGERSKELRERLQTLRELDRIILDLRDRLTFTQYETLSGLLLYSIQKVKGEIEYFNL